MREFVELKGEKFLVGLQLREPALEAALTAMRIPLIHRSMAPSMNSATATTGNAERS